MVEVDVLAGAVLLVGVIDLFTVLPLLEGVYDRVVPVAVLGLYVLLVVPVVVRVPSYRLVCTLGRRMAVAVLVSVTEDLPTPVRFTSAPARVTLVRGLCTPFPVATLGEVVLGEPPITAEGAAFTEPLLRVP